MFERNPDKSIDVTADGAVALVDDFATAGEQEEISTPPMSDKRGYGNLSGSIGVCHPERSDSSGCHPERAKRVEGSRAAAGARCASESMAASDVAFLAPERVSEAEGPVPVPAPAEGRLGYRFVKRVFDIAFSLCATIVGLVPIALLCVAIGLESPGSPIYLQKRVGYQGRPLRIFKLRTMVADSDDVEKHLDPKQLERWRRERKVDDDPRVTKVGRFLRRTSLDELPQFLNVLAGQMSVVGPRPIVEEELAAYGDAAGELLSVKPGITGWWQVQARNDATYGDGSRQELELYYVRNASLAIDAKVFLRTFSIMFGKGRTGR